MKRRVNSVLVFLMLVLLIVGCSADFQDKPLPMSQNNIEKCAKELNKAIASIAPSTSQDSAELVVGAYKMVIEEKMGYSFDKTYRSVILFYQVEAGRLMIPVISYVESDPKRALDKGFISQRTFDILDTRAKVGKPLTKEGNEFIGFVTECQNKNNGTCDLNLLINILSDHNALRVAEGGDDYGRKCEIISRLEGKYDVSNMCRKKWITLSNGQSFIFGDSTDKFIVNKNQIEMAKRYSDMLAEEKVAMSE